MKCFVNDGTPQPQIVGSRSFFCMMILVVFFLDRGRGIFHPVAVSFFYFSPNQFVG